MELLRLIRICAAMWAITALQPGTLWAQHMVKGLVGAGSEASRFVDNELIVVLKPAAAEKVRKREPIAGRVPVDDLPSLQTLIKRHHVSRFRRQFPEKRHASRNKSGSAMAAYFKVQIPDSTDVDSALRDFAANEHVDHIERIGLHPLYLEPNDTYYDAPPAEFPYPAWRIKQVLDHDIDGNLAWDIETGDPNVIVGVMESGVRYVHRDLGGVDPPGPTDAVTDGNIWVNSDETPANGIDDDGNGYIDDVIGYDFVETAPTDRCASNQGEDCASPDNDPHDFDGHGTAVAGCIAAITNNARGVVGVAGGYSDGTLTGTGNGARIMCLRIGWHARDGLGYVRMDFAAEAIHYAVQKKLDGHNVTALNCSWGSSNSGGLDAAVNEALAADIMIIHAAGNDGGSVPDFLGGKAGVLNAASTNSSDMRSSFSNHGAWVDLAAPGEDIITTYHSSDDPAGDYVVVISGTSFSSPITCGVAALLESFDPSLTGPEKFQFLVTSGDDIGAQDVGLRLNARRALDSAAAHLVTCQCDCFGDPACDSVSSILDVVYTVEVAFRNGIPIPDPLEICPWTTTDVSCDGATDIIDVVRTVNVAFRNGDPAVEFCDPCGP